VYNKKKRCMDSHKQTVMFSLLLDFTSSHRWVYDGGGVCFLIIFLIAKKEIQFFSQNA
jgi:hypothetical protein